jgi:nitrogenase molybdenum-cofactor synthesis protein NifE
VRVLSCISGDGRYHEVASSHRAKVNMMVCSKSMINIATRMQNNWGIPYFEGSFYGIGDMSDTLRQIARLLVQQGAGADLIDRTERLIEVEEARAWKRLEPYKARLAGKRVLLITGGVKSWSVVSALQEVGMEIVGTSIKKSTKEDKEKIKEIMGDDAHMIDDMTPREMYNMLRDARADIMLSGGRSQFIALKARMPWLDINQERYHPYAGYEGMVELVEEIDKALYNPVWEQVRIPAPWDEVDAGMLAAEPFVPPPKAGGEGGGHGHDHGHGHGHGHGHDHQHAHA